MYRKNIRLLFSAVFTVALIWAATLWSFNELSSLFGGPQAKLIHAVAATFLVLTVAWLLPRHSTDHNRCHTNLCRDHRIGGRAHVR
jgi:hypothetical protein